jgi:hypothetical protein
MYYTKKSSVINSIYSGQKLISYCLSGLGSEPRTYFVLFSNTEFREAGLLNKKVMLSSNFRCYKIHNCQRHDFGHTLLFYLSPT